MNSASEMAVKSLGVLFLFLLFSSSCSNGVGPPHNYADALSKCLLFFEGQRSGKLPPTQRLTWRKDSALDDGRYLGVDLTGGYYDAGDNVKFGFPMAFTTTVLAWSIIEFSMEMGGEVSHALEALRWGTDYLLKATFQPNTIFVQVGDPYADHDCWERPEDMDTPRSVYAVDTELPGSEVAAETAAALAAASIVFRSSDPGYADTLFTRAKMVYDFGNKYLGSYSKSLGKWVCPFYCDWSGYQDELMWGAAWITKASQGSEHLNNTNSGIIHHQLGVVNANGFGQFGWDDKTAGVYILNLQLQQDVSKEQALPNEDYRKLAEEFACTLLPESPTLAVKYTPGGLLYKSDASNMQNTAALSFLLLVFARYLNSVNGTVKCGNMNAPPSRLIELAKSQVDYILGDNPMNMSYMVGYGTKFPQRIHHRGSSLPSIDQHPQHIPCKGGTPYYLTNSSNPNLLIGAIVGGPNNDADCYPDSRPLFAQSEPTTYINAPMVGLLAYFSRHG